MITDRETGTLKALKTQGNLTGRTGSNNPFHRQRIEVETANAEYKISKSYRHLEQVKKYAELIGNYKK